MTDIFDRAMKRLQHVADVTGYDYDVGVGMEALEEQQRQIKELKDALWPFLYGAVPLASCWHQNEGDRECLLILQMFLAR